MTIIYLMRHSKAKMDKEYINTSESLQLENEKFILSVEGEELAKKYSKLKELKGLNNIYSSNYVRAMATAKYVCEQNKKPLFIDEDFNERKFGINSWEELPKDFFENQALDEEYKMPKGESKKEVKLRMYNALMKVVKQNKNKKALVVTHGSAMMFLFEEWCDITYDDGYVVYFGNKLLLDRHMTAPDLFKLTFDDKNKLTDIEHIIP